MYEVTMYEVTVHSETHKPGHATQFHQHTEFFDTHEDAKRYAQGQIVRPEVRAVCVEYPVQAP